jgi:predicted dehydrogenase
MGNIGKRHLQAVSGLKLPIEIVCYDINRETVKGVVEFCRLNAIATKDIVLLSNYDEAIGAIGPRSIVIVATTAQGRKQVLRDVIGRKPDVVIAEKPLCQNLADYDEIISLAGKSGVPVYIDFNRHAFEVYKQIKEEISAAAEKTFFAVFPDGMACIGIHILDLMTWLLSAREFKLLSSKAFGLCETKRPGCHDFYGEMVVALDSGSLAFLDAARGENVYSVKIVTRAKEYNVFEFTKKMVVVDSSNRLTVREIEVPFISQTTGRIVADIIEAKKVPDLPTIEQSYLAHKILFEYMESNSLENANIT